MDSKKIRKSLARFAGWVSLILCSLIIKTMSARYIYGFAGNIAFLGFRLARKQKKIALESLKIAFGKEKSEQEREQIAKDCFIYMAKSGFELLFLVDNPDLI